MAGNPAFGIRDYSSLPCYGRSTKHHYAGVEDLIELAGSYAASISANHPFFDGNKRTAFYLWPSFWNSTVYR